MDVFTKFSHMDTAVRGVNSMKYYVDYVQRCEPQLKQFNSYEKALEFALTLYLESVHNADNWVVRIFKGEVLISEK